MKILIAIPTYESIYPDTFKSIYELDKGGHDVDFDFIRGYDVARARNMIAKAAVDRGYDYVLMVDNDEVIPKDALINLLEDRRDIVVGYCLSRPKSDGPNTNGRTTAFKYGGKDYVEGDAYSFDELKKARDLGVNRLKIRGSGLGCALIHRSVFKRMPFPYFKWVEYASGTQLSEDLYFCEQLDCDMYIDTRVACGHMMRFVSCFNKE